ncbi:phenylalanine--tRNA ligase subunit alpha, partial [Candidatus Micrarchaeota archaeon]|nr:phenylalanine--tRNA ligase subunit alpha [Candidatus Micrarchaeota archaeon]
AFWLQEKGMAKIEEEKEAEYRQTAECKKYLKEGFPEIGILEKDGKPVKGLGEEGKIGLVWAKKNGWITIEGGKIKVLGAPAGLYPLIGAAENPEKATEEERKILLKRKLLEKETKKEFSIMLTEKGKKEAEKIGEIKDELGELTHEMLVEGSWERGEFKPYALAPTEDAAMGKVHPLTRMVRRVKRVFLDMGFEEMEGDMVESSFWNFDALFQPQDHPARELADTFYVEGEEGLPEKDLVEKVKKSHEEGWKYNWSGEEAKKRVLRTHTTVLSAQHLHKLKEGEAKKYFAVGRVFRNEATDFKHLAEFHQVEGIVAWEGATFRDLLGLLKEFYRRFGFEKIRFRPSYFPYTEPSVEVEVFFEERGEWMELGGAGIFRPEMTEPLCDVYPVLAWGLSLERPMMLMEGLKDIRTFYKNDLDWLKGQSVDR